MTYLPTYREAEEYRQFLFRYLKDSLSYDCIAYDNLIDGIAFRLCFIVKSDRQVQNIFWDEIYNKLRDDHPVHKSADSITEDSVVLFFKNVETCWMVRMLKIDNKLAEVIDI